MSLDMTIWACHWGTPVANATSSNVMNHNNSVMPLMGSLELILPQTTMSPSMTTQAHHRWALLSQSLMTTGPIFREVTGKFDLWRSRHWQSDFKSDMIWTLQPLQHCSVGYQPSKTWLTLLRRLFLQVNRRTQARWYKHTIWNCKYE